MNYQQNFDVSNLNSFNLPVTAEYFCAIYSVDELASANAFAKNNNLGVIVLGEGTNIILPSFVVGLVIKVEIKGINIDDSKDLNHPLVTISAGENWHNCVKFLLKNEIYGVENLSLIPGSVGASVIQNIGAYGVELSDVLSSVEVFDLKTNQLIRLSAESCGLSYRDSIFKNERQDQYVITSITLKLYKSQQLNLSYPDLANYFNGKENPTPIEVSNAVITIRRNKLPDPQFEPNVGSFFKNPIISRGRLNSILSKNKDEKDLPHTHIGNDRVKISAAWLIDKCGLKGLKIGGVEVHKKQPLVLINRSNINDQDVFSNLTRAVMEIKQKVQTKYGISLEIEPRIYGDFKID